uniref:Motile sperm domain-containing protein 1 n=1 Tax=Ascaris suum TaxID=6253 RepID=F1L9R5_ASCSU
MDEQTAGTLPVFVFPGSIDVIFTQPHTHKQLVTLYNPYEFPISYRVLCTAPKKYSVIEPRGTLKAKCCVDIVIRHLGANIRSNIGVPDRFRFEVCKYGYTEVSGRKDIAVRLVENASDIARQASLDQSNFHASFPPDGSSRLSPPQYAFPSNPGAPSSQSSPWLAVVAALACIGALMLPTQGDMMPSLLPTYLHLSVPQKLVAAYVLGIVTMLIIRPT